MSKMTSHLSSGGLQPERSTDSKTPKRPSELCEGCCLDDCLQQHKQKLKHCVAHISQKDCLDGSVGARFSEWPMNDQRHHHRKWWFTDHYHHIDQLGGSHDHRLQKAIITISMIIMIITNHHNDDLWEFDCLDGAAGALGPPLKSTDSKTPKPDPGLE